MKKQKKKISRVITVRLFISVLLAFVISSGVTYALLYRGCVQRAKELMYYSNKSIALDMERNITNVLAEYSTLPLLDTLVNGGDEAALETLQGSNYTYFIKEDGTIFISGNEAFIGRNVSEIPNLYNIASVFFRSMKENPDQGITYVMSADPVKTLDGKQEAFYIVASDSARPDAVLVEAFYPEDCEAVGESVVEQSTQNRNIGLSGFMLVIDKDYSLLTYIYELIEYHHKTFPYTEVLKRYDEGIDENIVNETKQEGFYEQTLDIETKLLFGRDDFWGTDCFYCVNRQLGVYILSLYPAEEALEMANGTIGLIVLIEIVVFAVLFIVLHVLIKRRFVRKLDAVNASLAAITGGDLNERVEIRDTREFDSLSTSINTTVDRLKAYIAEVEARMERDLSVAKEVQTSALPNVFPPFPEQKEFELYASMHAAKEVGGDFYDFFMLNDRTLGFLIADVSGKSIPGAMFMMTAKTVIKSLAESGLTPEEVFSQANDKLCENNDAEMFITAWMGYLDLKTGLVRVANAGHNPPVLIRDGKAEYVKLRAGLVLASMEGMRYREQTVQLQPGDILYLYTDGVTEAMDKGEELYGEERLQKILSFGEKYPEPTAKNGTVASVCRLVSGDLAAFTAGAEQSDDITMLCIRYLGGA